MTSFISALLTAIMMMCGIGSGSVTFSNIAITINDQTYELDPAITAAYTIEEGMAAGKVYLTMNGERLFNTAIAVSPDGFYASACNGESVHITGEFLESIALAKEIDFEQFTNALSYMIGNRIGTVESKVELSRKIMREWSASLESEPVVETVNGEEVTLNHLTGTIDNNSMLATIDTVYRELLGDELYATFVKTMGSTVEEGEYTELSDFYKAMGLSFAMDVDAVVDEEAFGTWDVILTYQLQPTEEIEGFNAQAVMHVECEDENHVTCEVRMDPSEELPVEFLCNVSVNGSDIDVYYDMAINGESADEDVTMFVKLTGADGQYSWNFCAGTAAENVSVNYEYGKRFEAAVYQNDTVLGALKFDVAFGDEGAGMSKGDAATVIANEDDLNGIDLETIITGYGQDFVKLMNNDSVAALVQTITPEDVEEDTAA